MIAPMIGLRIPRLEKKTPATLTNTAKIPYILLDDAIGPSYLGTKVYRNHHHIVRHQGDI